jgi:hypothetical protein
VKKFNYLIGVLLFAVTLNAQPSFTISDKEGALAIKKNILAVVLEEEDSKEVKKLTKKPDELKSYKQSIIKFNDLLKSVIQKEWSFSKEVKFITQSEAEKLKDEKARGYSLLYLNEVTNYKVGDFYSVNKNYGFNSARDLAYHMSFNGRSLALSIANTTKPKDEVVTSFLPAVGISQGSLTFMAANLQNQLADCLYRDITKLRDLKDDVEKRRPSLKEKTLLIFDPLISVPLQKVIDKKEISKFYDYKYEVVTFEKAEQIIASKDKSYAYVWVIPAGAVSNGRMLFNYFIIDAADSRPLYLTGKVVVGSNGDIHQYHLMNVNKKVE